jgi:GNAT superfamily N-acetyltransferase
MSTELETANAARAGMGGGARPDESAQAAADGISFRPVVPAELAECATIWRESINDYLAPRNLPLIPDEPGPIGRLYRHLQATDPTRFIVATRPALDGDSGASDSGERIVAFASALERERLWYLSMLFVRPDAQSRGLGRALLDRVLPSEDMGLVLATATDSMQPISNALYAAAGIVPRMPLLSIVGRPNRREALAPLPDGVDWQAMESVTAGAELIDDLDAEIVGFRHPQDHAFILDEGRQAFLYRNRTGGLLGYGYTSTVGRIGPVAVRDQALLWPVLSHLLTIVEPRGPSAVWGPGLAGPVVTGLLSAGFRLDDLPILVCWSEPFADFRRYLPNSPGLL